MNVGVIGKWLFEQFLTVRVVIMKSKKIVVIEGELIDSMILKLMLKLKGYFVLGMASNGEDAISLVEPTHPDLVIMDINLKGSINGIEIAMQIREGYGIPVIFVTADFSKVVRKRVDLVGQACLKKPITHEDLGVVVHSVLYNSMANASEINERNFILCKT